MNFKLQSTAAVAASLLALVAGTQATPASKAIAAEAPEAPTAEAPLTAEVVPVFVAKEVVQPLPAEPAPEKVAAAETTPAPSLAALVARTHTTAPLDAELECLAGAIYFESRGEPLAGQLAVAQVVVNRSESSRFPRTYCGVVKQAGQFSFVKGGRIPAPSKGTAAWRKAQAIARIAHEGSYESAVGDSLFFHATHVSPNWGKRRVATISSHVFYR